MNRSKRFQSKRKRAQTNSTGKSKFKRGLYKPINEGKYKQPIDRHMNKEVYPEYRSSYEHKLMRWCDGNKDIEYWTCEPFPIPYISPRDGKTHRYYIDFLIKFKDGKQFLIEVKPSCQVNDPVVQAKAKAAMDFGKKHGMEFKFMTEKELGISKKKGKK